MDETAVPAHPVVEIDVSEESITVDGVVVDRGSAGGPDETVAMHLGVHAAARRVAQPLGRPVHAVLRSGSDEKRLVIYPDGSVTDVEDTFPVISSLIAPPGSRATHIIGNPRPRRRMLPAERTRLAMTAAYAGLGLVLATGVIVGVTADADHTPLAEGSLEAPSGRISPDHIILGSELERLPGLSDVVAAAGAGSFQFRVTTGRAAKVTVLASPLVGGGPAQVWTIRTAGATTRTLAVDDVEAGAYRWVVRTSGEPARTGNVVVQPTPDPPVVIEEEVPETDPTPDTSSPPPPSNNNDDDNNGGGTDSSIPGPTGPVDPDDPTGP